MLWMFWSVSPPIIRSSRTVHMPGAVCTVLELLMMGGETARNVQSIDNNKEYFITLHPVGCTKENILTMHSPMNVRFLMCDISVV